MTTQELLKLAVLICVLLHITSFSWVSCCCGHYWSPSVRGAGPLSGHSYEEEKNGALQGPGRITAVNMHRTILNCKMAGQEARQDPRVSQTCIRDIPNDSSRPLQNRGKKFLQLQAGVSTPVCLEHFHHQIPISFSLLQQS